MRGSSKLPEDINQRAAEIVRLSTEEVSEPQKGSTISEYLSQIGRRGGLKGGKARAKKLTKKRVRAIGKKATKARLSKPKQLS